MAFLSSSGELRVRIGPIRYLIRARLPELAASAPFLYADYPPLAADDLVTFTVEVGAPSRLRRVWRRQAMMRADHILPGTVALPARQAQVMLEMALNLQIALGHAGHLVVHASSVGRAGGGILLSALSGSGKSTLAAGLGYTGRWRFMGDEFALIDPATGLMHAFPRPISLKNAAIDVLAAQVPPDRLSARIEGTPKGTLAYLKPPPGAIADMDVAVPPRLILFPRYDAACAPRWIPLARAETAVQLIHATPNYVRLGEAGFRAFTRIAQSVPAYGIDYASLAQAEALIAELWDRHGG